MPQALVGLIAAAGVTGLTTTAGGLTLVGGLLSSAIGLGLNFAIREIIGQPKAQKPEAVKNVIQQSVPVRRRVYGHTRVGGKLLKIETINGDLWQIIYVCEGPIEGFTQFYLDDRTAWPLSPEGHVLAAPWQTLDGAESFVHIQYRLGTPTQTTFDEFLEAVDTVGGVPGVWSEDHRARGAVVVMLRTSGCSSKVFTRLYPNRISKWNGEPEAAKIWDPRLGSDPAVKLYYNPATPGFVPGQNLPLITLDYLTHPDGAQIDVGDMDVADFVAAADRADALIPTYDSRTETFGTTHRYYGQLVYELDEEPGDVTKRLINAVAGRLYLKTSGKIGYDVGRWVEPTLHLTDADIFDLELTDRSGPLRDANEVIVKWTNPNARYSEATADPWRNEGAISETGKVKSVPLERFEAQSHNHARRLAKIESHRLGPRWQGYVRANLRALEAIEERFIYLTLEEEDIDTTPFEVLAWEPLFGPNNTIEGVHLQVGQLGPEAFEFDPETEEGEAPEDPVDLSQDATPDPINLVATVEHRKVNGDEVAVLVAQWEIGVERGDVSPEAEYSVADQDQWFPMRTATDGYPFLAEATGLKDSTATIPSLYDARARFNLAGGAPGNWVVVENILIQADDTPPPKPVETSAELDEDDDDTVIVGFMAGDDPDNTRAIRIYRRPAATPWDIETAAWIATRPCQPGASREYRDRPGVGTWTYDFVPVNGSGVLGSRSDFPATVDVGIDGSAPYLTLGGGALTLGGQFLTIG